VKRVRFLLAALLLTGFVAGVDRRAPDRCREFRRAVEGARQGRPAAGPAREAARKLQRTGPAVELLRRRCVYPTLVGEVFRRAYRPNDRHRRPERHDDRRAGPHRTFRWHDPGDAAVTFRAVVRGGGRPFGSAGGRYVPRPGGRAHPARDRPPAVRARTLDSRRGPASSRGDDHRLHRRAQPDAGCRDAGLRERTRSAGRGSSRSRSGCCTASASRAR